ncbi:MAG: prepilin-type N-terminal cleavage/methylation domain-containing protein [Candidatus Omnitrophica bacterium]|nr:prepilin-type N-terminal cleavage/methylation domain-containing protein [Candidatus Omnitrophota bacterium]
MSKSAQGSRLKAQVRGLTFVELLLAVTMVAILFAGLSTHLRGGIRVWQRVTQSTEARQQLSVALERMSRDLAHAIVLDARPEAYAPTSDAALLPVELNGEELAVYTAASRQWGEPAAIRRVSYWCGQLGEQQGLWRSSWSVAQVWAKRGPDPELLVPECDTLSLAYAYLRSDDPSRQSEPLDWRTEWQDSPQALPRLIRMRLAIARTATAVRVAPSALETVFLVPAGVLRPPAQ